jgi:Protein of unknown function (DUF3263)
LTPCGPTVLPVPPPTMGVTDRRDGEDMADQDMTMVSVPSAPVADAHGSTLSALEESILEFERTHWRRASAKHDAIRSRFGMSPTAYFVILSRLIDADAAMAYDPLLVQRLQRRVAERSRWRSGAP